MVLVEPHKVVGLQQHVAEFGVTQTGFAAEAAFDAVFAEHHVDWKVLAHVPQKRRVRKLFHPIVVVDEDRRLVTAIEIEQVPHLRFDAGDVGRELLFREQIPFSAFAAWVADHAGRTAHDRDRTVACFLESPQHHQWKQTTDV